MATDPKNLVGTTLSGRYKIERAIGEGGMGAIFEATQLSLGRHVAIKVVKSIQANDDEAMKRFERETEIISRLNHPNIVQVVDAGRSDEGVMYLAMELLSGESVKVVLRREGPLTVPRALSIIEDVASALVAAHGAGVIHRDLKAENVMLVRAAGRNETAKVLDFGVAKMTRQTEAPPVTGSGFVAGTPGCIAPEQMLGKSDDPRSDLYSLGVLLFEMLSGQAPFSAPNSMELMVKHLMEPPPRLADVARARGREVPLPVDELVASLLAKDPDLRPGSAEALLDIVRGLQDASRATQPDVRMPSFTPGAPGSPLPSSPTVQAVGSKVVAVPPVAGATPGTASASPAPHTVATTLVPRPFWQKKKKALRAAGLLLVVVFAVIGAGTSWVRFAAWQCDRYSTIPEAEAETEQAIEAYWNLDLERASHHLDRAISFDEKGAAWAYALRGAVSMVRERPIARVDADFARALAVAKERGKLAVGGSHTAEFLAALTASDPQEAAERFRVHRETRDCGNPLEAQLFAARFSLATTNPFEDEKLFRAVGGALRPATAFGIARALRHQAFLGAGTTPTGEDKKIAEARRMLEQDVVPQAGGCPYVALALAELDLVEGKRDVAKQKLEAYLRKTDDLRVTTRLAHLQSQDGDDQALERVRLRIDSLPRGADSKVDGYGLLGHLYASDGRLARANEMWRRAIDESDSGEAEEGRSLELRSYATLLSMMLNDMQGAARWQKEFQDHRDDLPADNPSWPRLRAMSIGARALIGIQQGDKAVIGTAAQELKRLDTSKQEVKLIAPLVAWFLNVAVGKPKDAAELAARIPSPCWKEVYEGRAWRRVAEIATDDAQRADALAKATEHLDAATSARQEARCTTGFNVMPFLQRTGFAHALVERAALAASLKDWARVEQEAAHFKAYWPLADADVPDAAAMKAIVDAMPKPAR